MNFLLNNNSGKPAYVQLYQKLVEDILSGAYPFGSRLPSKRMLAEETGLSVITVEHAVSLLCEEGYVESRQRSGYYVIYRNADFLGDGRKLPSPASCRSGRVPLPLPGASARHIPVPAGNPSPSGASPDRPSNSRRTAGCSHSPWRSPEASSG